MTKPILYDISVHSLPERIRFSENPWNVAERIARDTFEICYGFQREMLYDDSGPFRYCAGFGFFVNKASGAGEQQIFTVKKLLEACCKNFGYDKYMLVNIDETDKSVKMLEEAKVKHFQHFAITLKQKGHKEFREIVCLYSGEDEDITWLKLVHSDVYSAVI